MPGVRDHQPIVIEQFGGLWARGDAESCPSDHFIQADNVQYFHSGVETRDCLSTYSLASIGNVRRVYDYVMQSGQSLLVLVDGGKIYHIIAQSTTRIITPKVPNEQAITQTIHGPILTIPAMEDFGFIAINGKAYITPFKTYTNPQGMVYELGIQNEHVYVYNGSASPLPTTARKAAGVAPSNGGLVPFLAYNSVNAGSINEGIHAFLVSNDNSQPGPTDADFPGAATGYYRLVLAPGNRQIQLSGIPLGPGGTVVRTIQMTKAIPPGHWNSAIGSYVFYKALDIPDNTTTTAVINVTDAQLTVPYNPGGTVGSFSNALIILNSGAAGFCDYGFHLIAVVYETDTGYITGLGPEHFGGQTFIDSSKSITAINIPVSPDSFVKKKHLVSTKTLAEYNGDQKGYQYFFIPGGDMDNFQTEKTVSYYDSDLVSDASHLIDNFSQIPAGVNLNTYHSRMVVVGEYGTTETLTGLPTGITDNRSLARLSQPGDPEAFNKIDGLIIAPLDGNPLTNCQEYRDILYLFKKTRTFGYSDNGDEPSTWREEVIDQGVGASVHGIGTVLDTGGVNLDFLLIADMSGLMLFNGVYARPELTWKIEDYWQAFDQNSFRFIQIANDSISKKIWITLPLIGPMWPNNDQFTILHADYGDGLDARNIRWARWIFDSAMVSTCLIETNKLILGSSTPHPGIYYIQKDKSVHWDHYYAGGVKIPDPTIRIAYFGE